MGASLQGLQLGLPLAVGLFRGDSILPKKTASNRTGVHEGKFWTLACMRGFGPRGHLGVVLRRLGVCIGVDALAESKLMLP